MPRKAPDNVTEHRITLGQYERNQVEQLITAEKWKDYADASNKAVIPAAALTGAVALGWAAYAFGNWVKDGLLGEAISRVSNLGSALTSGFVRFVEDPLGAFTDLTPTDLAHAFTFGVFKDAPPSFKEKTAEHTVKLEAAMNAYLADKTNANWDAYVKRYVAAVELMTFNIWWSGASILNENIPDNWSDMSSSQKMKWAREYASNHYSQYVIQRSH